MLLTNLSPILKASTSEHASHKAWTIAKATSAPHGFFNPTGLCWAEALKAATPLTLKFINTASPLRP